MIGLDTNLLVRFLVRDDEAQFRRARRLIRREGRSGEAVLVSLVVVLETEWVLRSRYGLPKSAIADTLSALLDSADVTFEDEAAIETALVAWQDSSADFADCLIGARYRSLGCQATATFDVRAGTLDGFVTV